MVSQREAEFSQGEKMVFSTTLGVSQNINMIVSQVMPPLGTATEAQQAKALTYTIKSILESITLAQEVDSQFEIPNLQEFDFGAILGW